MFINMMCHIKKRGNSCQEVTNKDIGVPNVSSGNVVLELRDVLVQGGEYIQSFLRTICLVVSQAMVVPVTSLCLKASLNLVTKSE